MAEIRRATKTRLEMRAYQQKTCAKKATERVFFLLNGVASVASGAQVVDGIPPPPPSKGEEPKTTKKDTPVPVPIPVPPLVAIAARCALTAAAAPAAATFARPATLFPKNRRSAQVTRRPPQVKTKHY